MQPAPGPTLTIAVETNKSRNERKGSGACAFLEPGSIRTHEARRFSCRRCDLEKAWKVVARRVMRSKDGDSPGGIFTLEREGPLTRSRIDAKVVVALAGRAAEWLVHGHDVSDGARSDLRQATALIAQKRGQLGMGDALVHHSDVGRLLSSDPCFARGVDAELQYLMASAVDLLKPVLPQLHALARALLERRVLTAQEAASTVEEASRLPHGFSGASIAAE